MGIPLILWRWLLLNILFKVLRLSNVLLCHVCYYEVDQFMLISMDHEKISLILYWAHGRYHHNELDMVSQVQQQGSRGDAQFVQNVNIDVAISLRVRKFFMVVSIFANIQFVSHWSTGLTKVEFYFYFLVQIGNSWCDQAWNSEPRHVNFFVTNGAFFPCDTLLRILLRFPEVTMDMKFNCLKAIPWMI